MSILNAMQAGVSGLKANATAVAMIGENIANTSTIGYKRTFAQMVTVSSGDAAGVRAKDGTTVEQAGATQMTQRATDLAIEGAGFFVVSRRPNDPSPANYLLTRAGSFTVDADGNLVNSAGYYLAGYAYGLDGTVGPVDRRSYGSLRTINLSGVELTAAASSTASISGNLPAVATGTGTAQGPFVSTLSYYTALGAEKQLALTWTPSALVDNQWTLQVADRSGVVYGEAVVDFFSSGATPAAPSSYSGTADPGLVPPAAFAIDADGNIALTIDDAADPQTLTISLGAVGSYDGVTQFAGDYEPQKVTVDGSEVSSLSSTEIDEAGTVWALFENGVRRPLYELPVATVLNSEGLEAVTGNAYRLTLQSGDLMLDVAGNLSAGNILSGTLESSNVDLAQEMTDLIMVQRAYSSNAKIVTTADELLQEANNLKR
ncbi:flagellar hook protein FlgE [Tabrizicola sp.]|uniref:flagellar hook protein FlgE n=1 Tax=Tabrizicola sp. TaxID=2005166 RepID=UPI0035AF587A